MCRSSAMESCCGLLFMCLESLHNQNSDRQPLPELVCSEQITTPLITVHPVGDRPGQGCGLDPAMIESLLDQVDVAQLLAGPCT